MNLPLPGVGDLFFRALNLYGKRFWTLIGIGVIATLALFVFQGVFAYIGSFRGPLPVSDLELAFFFILNVLAIVFAVLISLWQSAALITAVVKSEESLGAVQAYKQSWKLLFKFLFVSFLFVAAILGGTVLFVIPGIYLMIALSLAPVIVFAEGGDLTSIGILRKSREYVKGCWWSVFGRYLFLLLILIGFGILMGLVIFLPLTLVSAFNAQLDAFLRQAGNAIVDILLTPFTTIFWFFIYKDLKQSKEAA